MGMGRPGFDPACERARGLAALAPDGVLSELETRLLAAHVARCPSCARFARGVGAVAAMLRAAEPAPPPPIALPRRRRHVAPHVRPVAAAAAVALTAIGLAAQAPLPADDDGTLLRAPSPQTSERLEMQSLRHLRSAALAANDAVALEPLVPAGRFDPRPI
jgi:hypothetical protein